MNFLPMIVTKTVAQKLKEDNKENDSACQEEPYNRGSYENMVQSYASYSEQDWDIAL